MLRFALPALVVVGLAGAAVAFAPSQPPEMPKPSKEHAFFKQFVGEWESTGECVMAEGQPGIPCKGTDKARMLGGFWLVSNGNSEIMSMKMENVLALGYDPEKKKYVGQWIDSMMPHLWRYEGEVDASGKKLTLNTSGPSPKDFSKTCKYIETYEFVTPDHRVFTSSFQKDDGSWSQMVKLDAKRKK